MAKLISSVRTNLGGTKNGVVLLPGKTTTVDDADVERLLTYGSRELRNGKRSLGLGERLKADKLLTVVFDGSSAIARARRIEACVVAALALDEADRQLSEDEREEAMQIVMSRRKPIASPEGESSDQKSDAEKPPRGELALSAETLSQLSVAEAKPLIAKLGNEAAIEALVEAERAGKNRKGMLEALEDRHLEMIEAAEETTPPQGGG